MVPMLQCGLFRSNFAFAIVPTFFSLEMNLREGNGAR
jgi:hypothetical protein